jgi:hypothetical protein
MISDVSPDSSAMAKAVRFIIVNTAHNSMINILFFFNENTSLFSVPDYRCMNFFKFIAIAQL